MYFSHTRHLCLKHNLMMNKPLLFAFLWCAAATNLAAQTKWIAHRSHSGSDAHFHLVTADSPFEDDGSNFGKAPEPAFRSVELDSVIFLPDNMAVVITHEYYRTRVNGNKKHWNTLRDTVSNHPIFSAGYSLKEIKRRLKSEGYYQNPVNSVKFIKLKKSKKNISPKPPLQQKNEEPQQTPPQSQQKQDNRSAMLPANNFEQQAPPDLPVGWMIAGLACLACCTGLFSWLRSRNRGYEKLV